MSTGDRNFDAAGPDDATLVALIDGVLPDKERMLVERRIARDPAMKARLDELAAGSRPFRESYDALRAHAPVDRLSAALAQAMKAVPSVESSSAAATSRSFWRLPPAAIAAGLALFLVGTGAGHYAPPGLWPFGTAQKGDHEGPDAWRAAVAQYWGLTTSQTLVAMQRDPAATQKDLAIATARLGFPLSPGKVALPVQELKRVELFHYDGSPLVEIAYLDELNGPIAFCIYANKPGVVASPALEQRRGFNVVYWSDAERSYMLIGNGPDEIMQKLAEMLAKQVET
jgi:anti-sigma factor RsiW